MLNPIVPQGHNNSIYYSKRSEKCCLFQCIQKIINYIIDFFCCLFWDSPPSPPSKTSSSPSLSSKRISSISSSPRSPKDPFQNTSFPNEQELLDCLKCAGFSCKTTFIHPLKAKLDYLLEIDQGLQYSKTICEMEPFYHCMAEAFFRHGDYEKSFDYIAKVKDFTIRDDFLEKLIELLLKKNSYVFVFSKINLIYSSLKKSKLCYRLAMMTYKTNPSFALEVISQPYVQIDTKNDFYEIISLHNHQNNNKQDALLYAEQIFLDDNKKDVLLKKISGSK